MVAGTGVFVRKPVIGFIDLAGLGIVYSFVAERGVAELLAGDIRGPGPREPGIVVVVIRSRDRSVDLLQSGKGLTPDEVDMKLSKLFGI